MFRTLTKHFLPNPFDWKLKRAAKRGAKTVLLGWNRGLGDIALGLFAHGTPKWNKMGPWDLGPGLFKLFAVLSIMAMALIFYLGIQPPNDWALSITVGFLILTGIIWFAFENRRFQGPPIGDVIAKRQAEIAAAEAAIGEK